MKKTKFLFAVLSISLAFTQAFAQDLSTTGSIGGKVIDVNGAAVPGATVTVEGATGERSAVANNEGGFEIQNLLPGDYSLKVTQTGFKTAVVSKVTVNVGKQSNLQLTLEAGEVSATVNITDTATTIDQQSTAVGQNLNDQLFQNIPVQRSVSSLFYLSPGAADSINGGRDNPSIAGASGLDNLYIADGVNITDSAFGGIGTFNRSYGALGTGINTSFIKEVQVKTGGFEPQYGQSQGGIINITTQSGSNAFHGAVYGFMRPKAFEGTRRQPDDIRVNKQGKLLHEETYDAGVDVGGYVPGARNNLFFFGSFNPTVRREIVRGVEGNASDIAAGNGAIINTGLFNLLGDHARRYRSLNYAFKLDYNINQNHTLAFSIFGDPTKTNLSDFRTLNIDNTTGQSQLDYGTRNLAVRYFGSPSPVWTISASFSQGKNHFNETGFANLNLIQVRLPIDPIRGNYAAQGLGFFEPTESTNYRTTFDVTRQLHVLGSHTFGAGYQFQRSLYSGSRERSGPRYPIPASNASGVPITDIGGQAAAIGQLFNAHFRLRAQNAACTLCPRFNVRGRDVPVSLQVYRGEFGPPTFDTHGNYHAGYVQDTWRINKYISAIVGLRWEQEKVVGSPNAAGSRYSYTFTDQWAPRLGVTIDPFGKGKTKVWYNYGRFFEYLPLDAAERSLSQELDFTNFRFAPAFTTDAAGVRHVVLSSLGSPIPAIDAAHLLTGATGSGNIPGAGTVSASDLSAVTAGTKLGFSDEHIIGFEQQLPHNFVLSVRYQDRRAKRIIEDAAVLSPEAANAGITQIFFIGNPSTHLDAATNLQPFRYAVGAAVPAGCAQSTPGVPDFGTEVFDAFGTSLGNVCFSSRGIVNGASFNVPDGIPDGFVDPVRKYRAIEIELNKRFSEGWQVLANTRFARLKGNYEGHLRNDNGQTDPGISSLFDFTAGDFNLLGEQFAIGPLNSERRFLSNFYGSYSFGKDRFGGRWLNGLNLGAGVRMESGLPISEFLPHPVYLNAGEIPVGGRGKLGRTPFFTSLDMHVDYPWQLSEKMKLSFIADFFNVTNSRKVLLPDQFRQLDLGANNPDFLQPQINLTTLSQGYRLPFNMRLGMRFEF
ncbi:MAG: hypothetical protein C5B44_05480 [Acidobacteria bacterium]|nr:MAG: hypothetical protein C5B44_05480 [Acidobacteriota bacterium]